MIKTNLMTIEVVYCMAERQKKESVCLPINSTIEKAIQACGFNLPGESAVGVYGEVQAIDCILKEGDRVEIYRSLLIDPKQKRMVKVAKTNLPRRCQ